jgi:hypothetical protein
MNIEWTDRRGRRNIFVTEPLSFGPVSDPRHDYDEEVRRYGLTDDGTPREVRGLCWCRQPEDHWLHGPLD